jgi:hypothetical protein
MISSELLTNILSEGKHWFRLKRRLDSAACPPCPRTLFSEDRCQTVIKRRPT